MSTLTRRHLPGCPELAVAATRPRPPQCLERLGRVAQADSAGAAGWLVEERHGRSVAIGRWLLVVVAGRTFLLSPRSQRRGASGQPGVGSPRCGGVVTSSAARPRRRSVVVRSWRVRRMLPAPTPPSRAGDGTSRPGVDPMEGAVRQAARPRRRRQRARDPARASNDPNPNLRVPRMHINTTHELDRTSEFESNRHSTVARGCKTYCINSSILS